MKKIIKSIISTLLIVILLSGIFAYQGNKVETEKGFDNKERSENQVDLYPIEELNQDEIEGLMLMREEEKLARDVYLELYEIWGQQIFNNIASSEETHTNAIKRLIYKYSLEDPVVLNERGVFTNSEFEELYLELIQEGSKSLLDALIVGATIEDLDIKDLEELKSKTDNQDILFVYDNLEKGSKNHLRSFVKLIESNQGNYSPKYISQDFYNSIISSNKETGNQNKIMSSSESMRNEVKSKRMFSRIWNSFRNWFN